MVVSLAPLTRRRLKPTDTSLHLADRSITARTEPRSQYIRVCCKSRLKPVKKPSRRPHETRETRRRDDGDTTDSRPNANLPPTQRRLAANLKPDYSRPNYLPKLTQPQLATDTTPTRNRPIPDPTPRPLKNGLQSSTLMKPAASARTRCPPAAAVVLRGRGSAAPVTVAAPPSPAAQAAGAGSCHCSVPCMGPPGRAQIQEMRAERAGVRRMIRCGGAAGPRAAPRSVRSPYGYSLTPSSGAGACSGFW